MTEVEVIGTCVTIVTTGALTGTWTGAHKVFGIVMDTGAVTATILGLAIVKELFVIPELSDADEEESCTVTIFLGMAILCFLSKSFKSLFSFVIFPS